MGAGPDESISDGDQVMIRSWEPSDRQYEVFAVAVRVKGSREWKEGYFEIEEFTEFRDALLP